MLDEKPPLHLLTQPMAKPDCRENLQQRPSCQCMFCRYQPKRKRTVNAKDIAWAELIFVMEHKHKDRLKAQYSKLLLHKKVIVLDIPDAYQYMDEELVGLIEASVEGYLS